MVAIKEWDKTLPEPAWTGKKINDAESCRQAMPLTKMIRPLYTRICSEDQVTND